MVGKVKPVIRERGIFTSISPRNVGLQESTSDPLWGMGGTNKAKRAQAAGRKEKKNSGEKAKKRPDW